MEHTGFELVLTDYEKGFLTAHFEAHLRFEDYRSNNNAWWETLTDDMEWLGVQIGGRMFDICIWMEDNDDGPNYPADLVAAVYECKETSDGYWQTDTSASFFLKEAE